MNAAAPGTLREEDESPVLAQIGIPDVAEANGVGDAEDMVLGQSALSQRVLCRIGGIIGVEIDLLL